MVFNLEEIQIPFSIVIRRKWKYLIFILLFTEILILLTNKIDYLNPIYSNADFNKYIKMAEASPQLTNEIIRPFVYRIIVPWIVGQLPLSTINGFYLINNFALFFLAVSVFIFLLDFNVEIKIAFILTITFQLNRYFFLYNTWNYFQTCDVISLGILFISFILLKRKNWLMLFLIFPLSVLVKEYVLMFIPAGFIYLFIKKESLKNFFIYSILSITSIAIYFLIRKLIISEGGESLYTQYTTQVIYFSKPDLLIKRFIVPFTPFGLIPIIFIKETIKFFKKYIYLIIYTLTVIVLSFFGEPERLMSPLSIVILLYLSEIFTNIFDLSLKINYYRIFLITFFTIVFIASFYHIWGIIKLPTKELSMIFTFAVNVLMVILFLVFKNFSKFKIKFL